MKKKKSSPPPSLSLASTFTYLLASVVDFASSAPPFKKKFSSCSLLNEAIGTAALIALSQWDISYRGRAPIRVLKNPSLVSSTGWLHSLTMAFRKQDPSVYHSIERTSHTYLLDLIECYPLLHPLKERILFHLMPSFPTPFLPVSVISSLLPEHRR